MASSGFEFAYNMDGSNKTPKTIDVILGVAQAHKAGDLMLIQADGYADQVAGSIDEVTGVMAQSKAAADITAGTTTAEMYVIARDQVWKCSMDASTSTAVVGYTKTLDTVDTNTIDADDITNGSMTLVDKSQLDTDGNILAYVVFSDTTFGNA